MSEVFNTAMFAAHKNMIYKFTLKTQTGVMKKASEILYCRYGIVCQERLNQSQC